MMAKKRDKGRDMVLCEHEAGHAVIGIHEGCKVTAIVGSGHGGVYGASRGPLNGVAGPVGQQLRLIDMKGVSAFMEMWKKFGDRSWGFSHTDVPPFEDWQRRESLIVEAYEIICQHRELHREISDALFADGIWSNEDEAGRALSLRCFDIPASRD
jgi:hypothetical protein